MEAKPQERLPQQAASLPAETTAVNPLAASSLIKGIKIELKRTGCYSGRIDESWPKRSSNHAVRTFARYAKLSSVPEAPSAQLLELLKSKPDGLCPLECGSREVEQNGRCIKRATPPRAIGVTPHIDRPLSGIARADRAYRDGTYRECMGPQTGCYARAIKYGEDHARQRCSRRPTCERQTVGFSKKRPAAGGVPTWRRPAGRMAPRRARHCRPSSRRWLAPDVSLTSPRLRGEVGLRSNPGEGLSANLLYRICGSSPSP